MKPVEDTFPHSKQITGEMDVLFMQVRPCLLYTSEIDEMINSFAYRLQSQGLNLETYLKYTGMRTDNLREH